MGKLGGTQMYCPRCESVEVCAAIPTTALGKEAGQRWYRPDHDDIQWFRRGRECQTCGFAFLTSEVQEAFLDELVELRGALGDLKKNAERYAEASKEAEQTLHELTASLQVLRALKIYKAT
jgi:hypothetical protein